METTERKPLDIVTYPERSLTIKSVPVESFDANLASFLDDLKFTAEYYKGLGIAAPQCSKNIRAFLVKDEQGKWIEVVNPTIELSGPEKSFQEGCLSVPGYFEYVSRPSKVKLHYFDRNGEPLYMEAEGLLAVEVQHEYDHLEGIEFIDRLSRLKKSLFKAWHKKQIKKIQNYMKNMIELQKRMAKQKPIVAPKKEEGSVTIEVPTLNLSTEPANK